MASVYKVKFDHVCVCSTHVHCSLPCVQTKEEGKSLQQVIAKLMAVRESSSKQVTADLALIDIDHEFSPIASSGTTND